MYGSDSFHALTLTQQIGLAALSAAVFALIIGLTRLIVTGWPAVVRMMLALVLLWLFMWVAPQLYHSFYALVLENVPQEWVVEGPPPLGRTLRVITFTGPADAFHHAMGALGLLMVLTALGRKRDTS